MSCRLTVRTLSHLGAQEARGVGGKDGIEGSVEGIVQVREMGLVLVADIASCNSPLGTGIGESLAALNTSLLNASSLQLLRTMAQVSSLDIVDELPALEHFVAVVNARVGGDEGSRASDNSCETHCELGSGRSS